MIANAIESLREREMRRRLNLSVRKRGRAAAFVAALALAAFATLPAAAQDQQPQPPAQPPATQAPAPATPPQGSPTQPPAPDTNNSNAKNSKPPDANPAGAKPADAKQADSKQSSSAAKPGTDDKSTYDPFHAQQDVDVGKFYLNKGDVDAAIARFEDAIRLRDNFAEPRLLLAECYEKKHQTAKALKYYREYLKVFPDAPDRKKIEKKIEKLSS
jgi:Flp pilus assembly protein TadD